MGLGGRVGVVGGGIGGLTAALSLLRAGLDVHVYEQAPALGEIGAGVQVSPNASRVLHGLGLADALARTGVRPLAWHQRRWDDGRTLLRTPLAEPLEAEFGFPHYQMHRADLLRALADALPAERVHLGHRLTDLSERGERVQARFADGAVADFDVVVGADGIHSRVRRILFGPEHPRFTGCVAYRGLVPAERLRDLELETTAEVWMGPGRHFVRYFVSAGRLVNFVAIVEQATWTRESWTDRADAGDALAAYDGWHPQVRTILGQVEQPFVWALFDRAPLPALVGRPGDAARRRLPRDAAVHGPGRGAGHRGRRDPGHVPGRRRRRRRLRVAPLRAAPDPADHADPCGLRGQQDALSSRRRAGAARARRPHADRGDRLVVRGGGVDLRARRHAPRAG